MNRRQYLYGIVAGVIVLFSGFCMVHGAELYVAPDGDDGNAGTKEKPFATLVQARNAVRELIKADGGSLKKPVTVNLRGGTYRLPETVIFGLEDSGSEDVMITYAAYKNETPLLSGGVPVSDWRKTELQKGEIWVADVPWAKGAKRFHALFDGETLLKRSQSSSYSASAIKPKTNAEQKPWAGGSNIYKVEPSNVMHYNGDILKDTKNLDDVEVFIKPTFGWLVNYLDITSLNVSNHVLQTRIPGTYTLKGGFHLENALEYLDKPGEWALNSHEGKLYYWPESGKPGDNIIAPVLPALIRVEGKNDPEGDQDEPVQGLVFRGLTFSHCDRDVWANDDIGIQHDWDMFDKENSLLRFRGAANCFVDNCRFVNTGSGAIRVDLYGQHIRIENNIIRNVGGPGILFCGYGPGKKNVNKKNTFINNEVENCGTLFWHSPAVFVWQSGENHIAHNRVYNLGYMGMIFSGVRMRFFDSELRSQDLREHSKTIRRHEIGDIAGSKNWDDFADFMHARGNVVEYNEIHDCMKRLHDGNCIYLSAAGTENVVRRNLTYNHIKNGMIRTDDDQYHTLITENITIGNVSVNGLTLKRANAMENNILVQSYIRGGGAGGGPEAGSTIRRNIFYQMNNGLKSYITMGLIKKLKKEDIDYNLYFSACGEHADNFLKSQQEAGFDKNSIVADPCFNDINNLDFRLKSDSPALKLGFKPIEGIEKIGLVDDPAIPRLRKQGGLNALMNQ